MVGKFKYGIMVIIKNITEFMKKKDAPVELSYHRYIQCLLPTRGTFSFKSWRLIYSPHYYYLKNTGIGRCELYDDTLIITNGNNIIHTTTFSDIVVYSHVVVRSKCKSLEVDTTNIINKINGNLKGLRYIDVLLCTNIFSQVQQYHVDDLYLEMLHEETFEISTLPVNHEIVKNHSKPQQIL